jgi:NMD protein affecting ribosome stability and mRNA decay
MYAYTENRWSAYYLGDKSKGLSLVSMMLRELAAEPTEEKMEVSGDTSGKSKSRSTAPSNSI